MHPPQRARDVGRVAARSHCGRLVAVTRAFRAWALDHRPEFTMVYGAPVPGFSTPEEGGIRDAGGRPGGIIFTLFAEL